ncbi:MAG: dienelactone hydrolase family protein, partial [Chloroflexi bacterium]|nr:dienelactone hydrolase family protein [Chloroflexota bacterium]
RAIKPESIAAFDAGLTATGVRHRIVTYPAAPHSFFDRKAAEFATESAAAWDEILAFIGDRSGDRA